MPPSDASTRATYRHGDLRQALLEAGIGMARSGGPDAVVLREATRRAGVSPNAAYRHFADRSALVQAVSAAAQGLAADSMHRGYLAAEVTGDLERDTRARLRGIGVGYIRFAREEPGLFRAAFTVPDRLESAFDDDKRGASGYTPYGRLATVLDEMMDAGSLLPERRRGAELRAWAAVHGLGMLVIDGPLRGLDDATIDATTQALLDMVDRGI